jgi:ribosome maturation factor RimP
MPTDWEVRGMVQRGRAPERSRAQSDRDGAVRAGRDGAARAGRDGVSRDRIRTVVAGVLDEAGFDLEDLTISRAGRRHVVRVVVDSDGGVNLDAVAVASRAVSAALDAAEEAGGTLTPGEYTLEVSSPGIDRPLVQPRHWRRNQGRLVKVKAGERTVTARIVGVDDAGVELDVDGERMAVPHAELGPGRVQVDLARASEIEIDEIEEGEEDEE